MTRDRIGIGALTMIVVACALVVTSCRPQPVTASATDDKRYSLFTWDTHKGQICFVLVLRSQRDGFLNRWFPKRVGKCGFSELETELKKLPKDTEVLWEELPGRGFTYPSADVMDEIKGSAKQEGIDVVYAPILG